MKELMKTDVVGIGNALLDYQVHTSFEFLKQHHLISGSMTLVDANTQKDLLSKIHKHFPKDHVRRSSGGCAANTIAGIRNFGGSSSFIGKIGKDPIGEFYQQDLERIGVSVHLQSSNVQSTGTCLAFITPDAERTMITHLGIATELHEKDIPTAPIQNTKIVYFEGYLWDSPSANKACLKAMDIAKQENKKIALTFSDALCVERHFDEFRHLTQSKVDILFCNEKEALKATNTNRVEDAFRSLQQWCDIVHITTGPRGALVASRKENFAEEIPTWNVKLVDKLGAGDLYAAGVLYGLTHGKNLKESSFLGCYSATRIIQQMSARLEVSLKADIEKVQEGPTPKSGRQRICSLAGCSD